MIVIDDDMDDHDNSKDEILDVSGIKASGKKALPVSGNSTVKLYGIWAVAWATKHEL